VFTILPWDDSPPVQFDARRKEYNDLIRAHYREFADGIVDVCTVPELEKKPTGYFHKDHNHPNGSGYKIIAGMVGEVITGMR
jgi:lysophospholipase L1-like esterase